MSQPAEAYLVIKDLSKGLNTFDPDTAVPAGFYVDAQNMVLTNKAPVTVGGLTKFNTTAAPNSETIVWCETHTTDAGVTVLLVATSAGTVYTYNPSTDTWTTVCLGLTTGALTWTSVPFKGKLIYTNSSGNDPVFKFNGTIHLPVGATSISTFEDVASWTGGGASETTLIREGTKSLKHAHGGAGTLTSTRTLSSSIDLNTGLEGAPDFTGSDFVRLQLYVSDVTKLPTTTQQQVAAGSPTGGYLLFRYATTTNQYDHAYEFVANANYNVASVQLRLQKFGSITGTVHVELQTDAAGLPSNTVITNGTSASVAFNDLPSGAFSAVTFGFATAPALVSGTTYHLVVKGDWTPNGVDHAWLERYTDNANIGAYNSGAAPTTWTNSAEVFYWATFVTAGAACVLRIGTDSSNYYTASITQTLANGWNDVTLSRSAFSATASPSWSNITWLQVETTATGAVTICFDDYYLQYALSPPIGSLVEMYQQQLCVAGDATHPTTLAYSDAGTPDYFPAANVAVFSGGRNSFEKTDQITALRSYFDELVVGKVNSAWTFSGTGINVSISALPLTIGIDAHNGVLETPWSLHFPFENNIFGARLTSRGLVSTNISTLLSTLDGDTLQRTTAIRHDRTRTTRWSFRTTAANPSTQNDLGLIYDYQLDAWTSRYTPKVAYYTRALVDGNREILAVQYDGYIRRVDVGTTFDGTAIESYVTLPWMQTLADDSMAHVTRWINGTFYLKGTANVNIDARFADEPHEFAAAAFTTFKTIQATADGDKGFTYFGRTSRWFQLRLRATSGSFEVLLPIVIGYANTKRRV